MGSKKQKQRATLYFMPVHMGIARSIDELVEIEVGKKRLWWGSVVANQSISFMQRWLFGGDKKEGGIWGWGEMMFGKKTQSISNLASSHLPGRLSAFRGIASFFYYGELCANAPYPKPWRFRVRRTHGGWDNDRVWYPEKVSILQANNTIRSMNPAHLCYMLWTQSDFRGLPTFMLDQDAWKRFADELHEEGFGLCFSWSKQSPILSFMQQIFDHISGGQYIDRHTGLVVPVLIRGNYNADDIHLFTTDNGMLAVDEFTSDSVASSINEVIVNYKDPNDRGNKRQVREKNLGSIHAQNGTVRTSTIDYIGIPTSDLARRAARRDLNALSGHVQRFKIRFDRRAASKIVPAGLIRISAPELRIENMVLRVGSVDYGTFEKGEIVVEAATDIFGMPSSSFTPEEESGYVPPSTEAVAVKDYMIVEPNYRELANLLGAEGALQVDSENASFLTTMAKKPSVLSSNYKLHTQVKGTNEYDLQAAGAFCAVGKITTDIDCLAGEVTVGGMPELMVLEVGRAALIGEAQDSAEVVKVLEIDALTNQVKVLRGCTDTVPSKHKAGTSIWFYDGFTVNDETEYMKDVELDVKLQPSTTQYELSLNEVIARPHKFKGRLAMPYPAANLKINNIYYPEEASIGDLKVSWSHRNRITQAELLIGTNEASITPEEGTLYDLVIYKGSSQTVVSQTLDISAAEYTFSSSENLPEGYLTLELKAHRNGLENWQSHRHHFLYGVEPIEAPLLWNKDNIHPVLTVSNDGLSVSLTTALGSGSVLSTEPKTNPDLLYFEVVCPSADYGSGGRAGVGLAPSDFAISGWAGSNSYSFAYYNNGAIYGGNLNFSAGFPVIKQNDILMFAFKRDTAEQRVNVFIGINGTWINDPLGSTSTLYLPEGEYCGVASLDSGVLGSEFGLPKVLNYSPPIGFDRWGGGN